jgi:hypothetical protein
MSKIIKLKQSDIEKIVENVIKEQPEFDDFDTKIQPEELPDYDFAIGKDQKTGQIVVFNTKTGAILGSK